MHLDDFVIQIDAPGDDGHPMRVLTSPAGEGLGTFVPPDGTSSPLMLGPGRARDAAGSFPHSVESAAGTQRVLRRRIVHPPMPRLTPTQLGDRLFRQLFHGQVGQLFDRSLGGIGDEHKGLRLKIKIDPGDPNVAPLQSLPWELLYRSETAEFLSLSRRSPVVRYLDVPQPVRKIPLPKPLRVLAVTASPSDLDPLKLDREIERIQTTGRAAKHVAVDVLENATIDKLRARLLADTVHVLHFMGHGDHDPTTREGVLFFESEDGMSSPITGQALAIKLADVRSLALVFLNACHTAGLGPGADDASAATAFSDVAGALVRGGLPAVVAMRQAISDPAAIAFSSAFYRRLAAGDPVDLALTEGRQAIHSDAPGGFEWSIPILFARVASGDLFLRTLPRNRTASWAVAAVLGVAVLGGPWAYREMTQTHTVLSLDHVFASSEDGVSGRIESVEILADGRMRVYFSFANDTAEPRKIGLDMEQTYLADENGNAYEVRGWSAPIETTQRLVEEIPPGESREHWIEVDAPRGQARRMGVALAGVERADVEFPYFEVDLPEYPQELSPPEPERELPPESDVVDLRAELASDIRGLQAAVSQVAMVGDQAMRWSVDVFNRVGRDIGVGLVPAGFELIDDLGNVYKPLGHGLWQNPGKFWDGIKLPTALKVGYWLDFPPPQPGASRFTLRLATRDDSEVAFQSADVGLEDAVKRLYERYPMLQPSPEPMVLAPRSAPPPPPPPLQEAAEDSGPAPDLEPEGEPPVEVEPPITTFRLADGEKELVTTLNGLRTKLAAIDRHGNGRLRWHLQFENEGPATQQFTVEFGSTALSAGRFSYRVDRSNFGSVDDTQSSRITLPPGGESWIWVEFAGQMASMDDLMILTLASDSQGDVRFRPLMVRVSDVRPST